jgi:glycosyltransferase involved in cell wall biosynthesis
MTYRASIVIPAHNEEHRMQALLTTLAEIQENAEYAIFMVCNGCTDRTAELASEYRGITVVEINDVGKHFALNEGDRLADDIFPRLYCDADVAIDVKSIERIIATLTTDQSIAAGPTVRFDLTNCTRGVVNYYRAMDSPIVSRWSDEHLAGRGLYGASRKARRHFREFPPAFSDDGYFDAQFDVSEKRILKDATITLSTPKTFRELIATEVRVVTGSKEVQAHLTPAITEAPTNANPDSALQHKFHTLQQWAKDFRRSDIVPLTTYLAVKTLSRVVLYSKKLRGRKVTWR